MDFSTGQIIALVAIALLVLWLFWAWRFGRRYEFNLLQVFLYSLYLPWTYVYWRTSYTGTWPYAHDQGAVCVCNHSAGIDPFFIQRAMPKMARWMVAKEYFRGPMGWFLRQSKAIPVGRGGIDTAATKMAIRHAQAGGIVGVFPEGRINTTDDTMLPGRSGAALIALKAGVPIVPCYVRGVPYTGTPLSSFRRPAKVHVAFGQPIELSEFDNADEKELLGEITLRCLKEIARLAGDEDFEPKLAGRHWAKAQTSAAESPENEEVNQHDG